MNTKQVGEKQRGLEKVARIPVKVEQAKPLPKPKWIRAQFPSGEEVNRIKGIMREAKLHSVCEEASCPNLGECFRHGTASFMIMGDVCTRRCPFCDVGHGRPAPLDPEEPQHLAQTIATMGLHHVVITSVDRDDLRDGGAEHFAACIRALRIALPKLTIEILTPDFRGREEKAIDILSKNSPDVFNHNLETVPRLYRAARPGADYQGSLQLLLNYKERCPKVLSKSGLMLGLGEEMSEILETLRDLRAHRVDMLTLGQYLQPGPHHLPVKRYYTPEEFAQLREEALALGFVHVASAPLVRSSYMADVSAGKVLHD